MDRQDLDTAEPFDWETTRGALFALHSLLKQAVEEPPGGPEWTKALAGATGHSHRLDDMAGQLDQAADLSRHLASQLEILAELSTGGGWTRPRQVAEVLPDMLTQATATLLVADALVFGLRDQEHERTAGTVALACQAAFDAWRLSPEAAAAPAVRLLLGLLDGDAAAAVKRVRAWALTCRLTADSLTGDRTAAKTLLALGLEADMVQRVDLLRRTAEEQSVTLRAHALADRAAADHRAEFAEWVSQQLTDGRY
ncbi:hypothetical protein ACFYNO_26700 [Kitasatospora sp. NPDC006697]|uniref:hypothetical protein n=1 Tax=Kitasatospora sp. NPDC006697 TaxID=3364020 RepID=UPI003676872C